MEFNQLTTEQKRAALGAAFRNRREYSKDSIFYTLQRINFKKFFYASSEFYTREQVVLCAIEEIQDDQKLNAAISSRWVELIVLKYANKQK